MGGGERKGECIYRKMMIGGNEMHWEMKEGGATSMEPGYGGREEREEDGMGWGRGCNEITFRSSQKHSAWNKTAERGGGRMVGLAIPADGFIFE